MPQLLKILTDPNPLLHQKAQDIKGITPEISALIDGMVLTMRKSDGMGLAATQVGEDIKLAVVEYKAEDKNDRPTPLPLTVLINPKIISFGSVCDEREEGCLSVPGKDLMLIRPIEINVIYEGVDGRRRRLRAKGMPARIIQHEVDHLHGILITDRIAMQHKEKYAK
jgi:peptide deformylase